MRAPLLFLVALACCCPAAMAQEEGEGESPSCRLTDIDLLSPAAGSKWYLSDASVGLEAALFATVDCAEDVYSVSFYVKPGNGAQQPLGTPDYEPPYEARLSSFFAPPIGQDIVWTAEAKRVTEPETLLRTSNTVSLVDAGASDVDADGLPDNPLSILNRSDNRWLSSLTLSGEDQRVLTWMRTIRGNDEADLPDTATTELTSPENTGQKISVVFDRALMEGTQYGVLVVRFAPTLEALVGAEEAAQFSREPGGSLEGEGQYLAVSVLVSSNGTTYDDISPTRLAIRPIRVTLSGLTLDATREYTLARHPADFMEADGKLKLLATSGAWQSTATQSTDIAAGTITASLNATGVYAPYYLVDGGENTCPFGFCASNSLIASLLAGLSLLVLQFVPGGVGGGESPCFIATAAYGTPLAEDLDTLRDFRDDWLLASSAGTAFTDTYYRLSPPLAEQIAQSPALAALTRMAIMMLLLMLTHPLGMAFLLCLAVPTLASRFARAP